MCSEIDGYRDAFDASDPDDLAIQIDSGGDEAWSIVSDWRTAARDLEIAKAALVLYDFDPDAVDVSIEPTDE